MASLASRSVGIGKFETWLFPAQELWAIVKTSYLSPSFPFVLLFGLWSYLRRLLSTRNRPVFVRQKLPHWKQTTTTEGPTPDMRLLRLVALALTLILPPQCWAQARAPAEDPPSPAAPTPQQTTATPTQDGPPSGQAPIFPRTPVKTGATSKELLTQEEHQRILGVMPNFNTVDSFAGVPSLSPGQKFHLMYKSSVDPFVFVADAFVAGLSQARNTNPGFGQGAQGYGKRFGAAYLDTADGNLWGNAILPVIFKEDPRYFRLGSGTFTHRFLYSAATTIWCRRDNGSFGPNYANVLGNFISGAISNAYYPAADGGFGQTIDGALTVTAEGVIGAEFVEFWPDISRHLFKKHYAAQQQK